MKSKCTSNPKNGLILPCGGKATVGRAVLMKQLQLRLCRPLDVQFEHTVYISTVSPFLFQIGRGLNLKHQGTSD